MGNVRREAHDLLVRMALLSYGGVSSAGFVKGGEPSRIGPTGEGTPLHDEWGARFDAATDDDLPDLVVQARAELDAWLRRPLTPDTTETLDELFARIVSDGFGVSATECAIAMRCTPTMVRRARLAAGRSPDTGYPLPEGDPDRMTWARALANAGLSLRQIEALTGIAKSTLNDRLARA